MTEEAVRDSIWHRNLGDNSRLGEWPERAIEAAWLIMSLPLNQGDKVVDLGCGKQTLRCLLPAELVYVPVDNQRRSDDTLVMDLNEPVPDESFDVAVMLGLLEYLDDPLQRFNWCAEHSKFCVFSYADCSDDQRNRSHHWKGCVSFEALEQHIRDVGGRILQRVEWKEGTRLYAVQFTADPAEPAQVRADQHVPLAIEEPRGAGPETARPGRVVVTAPASGPRGPTSRKTLALFSSAVHCVNAGNAFIEDSVRRLLPDHDHKVFPLLEPLTQEQIEQVNACDAAIICGTNLYQRKFRCELTAEALGRITTAIIPLGVGSFAPIGEVPIMRPDGVKAVRMLHERCAVSSARDPLTVKFLASIGIRNTALTGCPVLFHSGREPEFTRRPSGELHLSIRAHLLQVDKSLINKEARTLDAICREHKPTIVIQGPSDLKLAFEMVKKYGLDCIFDEDWHTAPYAAAAKRAGRTIGFRLHYGMLGLSYGTAATFVATDSRVSSFCDMMHLPYHTMETYDDEALLQELRSDPPAMDAFIESWRSLRAAMSNVLEANGLIEPRNEGAGPSR